PFSSDPHPPLPPSFPTRRSSDLDARDALGERQRGESDHRLGDRLEGARDERRVLREVVREPRARELPRERERREERGQDRRVARSEEHTSELQSPDHLVCRLLLE